MSALVPLPRPGALITLTDYERMREAVAIVASADEAKAWADKAAAAAFYARQIKDREVETWLTEIRRRAEYRLGEMLLTLEPHKGGRQRIETGSGAWSNSIRSIVASLGLQRATAHDLMTIAGPRDEDLRAVGSAAAEAYYAQARETQTPARRAGLQSHIIAAIDAVVGPEEIVRRAKVIRRGEQAIKRERRDARELDLGSRTRAAAAELGTALYNVVYADPPWPYDVWSAETGMDRAAANHYPTMSLDDIAAMSMPAAPNCALFLWVTAPMLLDGGDVLRRWGFTYKTNWVWRKDRIGLGYWSRNRHEHLLLGTRGDVPAPLPGTQLDSVVDAALGAHSEKPLRFAEMIQGFFPTVPKVELFARGPRPGWAVWGNESDGGEL